MKFPYQGKIIKILGNEPVEAKAHLVTVPTTTPAPLIRDSAAKAISSVKKVFAPRSIDMNQYDYPDHMKRPWEILLKIGYTLGKGLSRQEQGMMDALETPEERSRTGLGNLGHPYPSRPLAWSLANYFISIGLQVHDKQVSDMVPNLPFGLCGSLVSSRGPSLTAQRRDFSSPIPSVQLLPQQSWPTSRATDCNHRTL